MRMILRINWLRTTARTLLAWTLGLGLLFGAVGCGDRLEVAPSTPQTPPTPATAKISEVSPPTAIQNLRSALDNYQPQVSILSPQPGAVLQDTTVNVRLQVLDLPLFQDPDLGLGPHLEVILDNQLPTSIYSVDQPLVLKNLEPGTHTLRVFATRPWNESFKNEGAYAQTTFHIFTKTQDNNPDRAQPLLTYNQPTGTYGAEPIMLDFYLTNAPLHLVARENPDDEILDWRVGVTVNGESFFLDRWEPIYLKGFQPGLNWVQLQFFDQEGNSIKNAFNNTVRLINYQPKAQDTLSKLVRGQISATAARGIVQPNYKPPVTTPTPTPAPTPTPEPPIEEAPIEEAPIEEAAPEPVVEEAAPEPVVEEAAPEPVVEETAPEPVVEETAPEPVVEETAPEPVVEETAPEAVVEEAAPEAVVEEAAPEAPAPVETAVTKVAAPGEGKTLKPETENSPISKVKRFLSRFRRQSEESTTVAPAPVTTSTEAATPETSP
ncbi:hypothetical protein [[Phormidium] sp. ETS-05]|uniref:hypothetical protein n=1 Tax=[Phormidium] sp. ETS-05 TaxID=222819 RepID=UPI0018EED3A3|nr:hypothetical protein [[Phormidium] sp. ETS-05]